MEQKKKVTDSWDAFTGASLKADDVKSKDDAYVVVGTDEDLQDGRPKLIFVVERDEIRKNFYLNATNVEAVRDLGVNSPSQIIGRKIYFGKIKVNNPKTKKQQDSLVIYKVEEVE